MTSSDEQLAISCHGGDGLTGRMQTTRSTDLWQLACRPDMFMEQQARHVCSMSDECACGAVASDGVSRNGVMPRGGAGLNLCLTD